MTIYIELNGKKQVLTEEQLAAACLSACGGGNYEAEVQEAMAMQERILNGERATVERLGRQFSFWVEK